MDRTDWDSGQGQADVARADELKAQDCTWDYIATTLGRPKEAIKSAWLRRHPTPAKRNRHPGVARLPEAAKGCQDLLPILRRGPANLEYLARLAHQPSGVVKGWLGELVEKGYNVTLSAGAYRMDKAVAPGEAHHKSLDTRFHRTIGIISDTHLCSKYQQLTHLNHFYDVCAARRVQEVYNAGDVFAGFGVYLGQNNDLFNENQDDQVDYGVEAYPRRPGIKTRAIAGNHDLVWLKRGGSDPVKALAARRDDIEWLGAYSAWVDLSPQCSMYLLHPDSGCSYAKSYRLQKTIESFQGGRKPNIAILGHWHSWVTMFERNVYAMLAGCFEAQTDYERRKAIQPQIGGTILDIEFDENGSIQSYKSEFVAYLVPKENDYPGGRGVSP